MPEDILSDSSQEDGLLWGRCSSVSGHHHIRGESFSCFRCVIGYGRISLSCFRTNVPFSKEGITADDLVHVVDFVRELIRNIEG